MAIHRPPTAARVLQGVLAVPQHVLPHRDHLMVEAVLIGDQFVERVVKPGVPLEERVQTLSLQRLLRRLDGFLELVSGARVGFVGLFRDEETLEAVRYFVKLPVDLSERNAIVIDGSGAARREADVAVRGERIAALGRLERWRAETEVDASGRVLAPGFIDVHTHDDRLLLAAPQMTPKLSQGVTTVIGGNCGISLAPLVADRVPPPLDLLDAGGAYRYPRFADYLEELAARPAALNAALLVGHSTLRVATMDRLDRAATKTEIARMRALVTESVDAGAIGLSSGLFYAPASAAPTEEVIELCAPLRERGALYVTHMRDEADHLLESLEETFRIGREAGVPAFISHHKAAGVANHGKTRESLAAIEAAIEADDSLLPQRLQQVVAVLCDILDQIVAEESGELIAGRGPWPWRWPWT